MKYTWEASDIRAGRYFIRGLTSKTDSYEYAMSCLAKIGWMAGGKGKDHWLSLAMTDGAVYPMGNGTKEDFVETLNKGNYVPMSLYEMAEFTVKYDREAKKRYINY